MSAIASPDENLRALRAQVTSVQLATLTTGSLPQASYAPCVWYRQDCYLFLSELASHTANLFNNSHIGLMLIEDAADAVNPFARRRLSLQGRAHEVAREEERFDLVLAEFHRRFGQLMQLLEGLPDFHLFCVEAESGSYVQGFGQAYRLEGAKLDRLAAIDPRS